MVARLSRFPVRPQLLSHQRARLGPPPAPPLPPHYHFNPPRHRSLSLLLPRKRSLPCASPHPELLLLVPAVPFPVRHILPGCDIQHNAHPPRHGRLLEAVYRIGLSELCHIWDDQHADACCFGVAVFLRTQSVSTGQVYLSVLCGGADPCAHGDHAHQPGSHFRLHHRAGRHHWQALLRQGQTQHLKNDRVSLPQLGALQRHDCNSSPCQEP